MPKGAQDSNPYVAAVKKIAEAEGADTVIICGKFEAELADLESEEDRLSFLEEAGRYCQEGKAYVVNDGDVMFFKFNV